MGIEEFLLDRAYKKGVAEAKIEKKLFFTRNFLTLTHLNTEKIGSLVKVDEPFVIKVRDELNQ